MRSLCFIHIAVVALVSLATPLVAAPLNIQRDGNCDDSDLPRFVWSYESVSSVDLPSSRVQTLIVRKGGEVSRVQVGPSKDTKSEVPVSLSFEICGTFPNMRLQQANWSVDHVVDGFFVKGGGTLSSLRIAMDFHPQNPNTPFTASVNHFVRIVDVELIDVQTAAILKRRIMLLPPSDYPAEPWLLNYAGENQ